MSYTQDMEEPLVAHELTALDRCDRCSARATGYAELVSGFELLFCAHHLRDHRAALEAGGARVHSPAVPAA